MGDEKEADEFTEEIVGGIVGDGWGVVVVPRLSRRSKEGPYKEARNVYDEKERFW